MDGWKLSVWSLVIFMLLLDVLATALLYGYSQWEIDVTNVMSVAVCVVGMYLATAFLVTLLLDTGVESGTNYFSYIVLEVFFLLFVQFHKVYLIGNDSFWLFLALTYYVMDFLIVLSVFTLWKYLENSAYRRVRIAPKVDRVMLILVLVEVALLLLNAFTHMFFEVNDSGIYSYTQYKWVLNSVEFIMMGVIALVVTFYEPNFRKKVSLYSVMLLPMAALAAEWFVIGVSMLGIAVLFSLLIIYGNFYVGRSEDLVKKDGELMQQRANILVSQIQPHFLYNALTSIMNIKGNPPETRDAIASFGKYLRGNLDILRQKGPISIMFELNHIDTYMELVNLNFGNGIHFETEIQDRTFLLPALTLQTLIESVIELGYGHSNPQGTMTLITFCDRDYHYAELSDDNGIIRKCYDLAEGSIDKFGLSSVNLRLKEMVDGDISFRSKDGDIVFLLRIPVA